MDTTSGTATDRFGNPGVVAAKRAAPLARWLGMTLPFAPGSGRAAAPAVALLLALLACLAPAAPALAAPTDPDTTYGSGGRTVTSFGDNVSVEATAAVHLADGRVLVAGSEYG